MREERIWVKRPLRRRIWEIVSERWFDASDGDTDVPGEWEVLKVKQREEDGNELPNASLT